MDAQQLFRHNMANVAKLMKEDKPVDPVGLLAVLEASAKAGQSEGLELFAESPLSPADLGSVALRFHHDNVSLRGSPFHMMLMGVFVRRFPTILSPVQVYYADALANLAREDEASVHARLFLTQLRHAKQHGMLWSAFHGDDAELKDYVEKLREKHDEEKKNNNDNDDDPVAAFHAKVAMMKDATMRAYLLTTAAYTQVGARSYSVRVLDRALSSVDWSDAYGFESTIEKHVREERDMLLKETSSGAGDKGLAKLDESWEELYSLLISSDDGSDGRLTGEQHARMQELYNECVHFCHENKSPLMALRVRLLVSRRLQQHSEAVGESPTSSSEAQQLLAPLTVDDEFWTALRQQSKQQPSGDKPRPWQNVLEMPGREEYEKHDYTLF